MFPGHRPEASSGDRVFGDPSLFVTREPAVADLGGIKDDLTGVCVGSMIAVGRVRNVTALIADARGNHAIISAKQVLHAPEAATSQNGAFFGHWISSTWSR